MSNYHVEVADKPQAITKEAIKSLRQHPVQGISRRRLLRVSIGGTFALWLTEVAAGTIGFLWPNLKGGFGGEVKIGTLDDVKLKNSSIPVGEGFPAYFPDARAFVVLVDPAKQQFVPGEDKTGDGTAINVRALYQRCPHLGCKPNPCLKNFWLECPCHGSRYDRLGVKKAGQRSGDVHLGHVVLAHVVGDDVAEGVDGVGAEGRGDRVVELAQPGAVHVVDGG